MIIKSIHGEDILVEWPCQQLLGGTGAAIYMSTNGMCQHPECHPRNDETLREETEKSGGGFYDA